MQLPMSIEAQYFLEKVKLHKQAVLHQLAMQQAAAAITHQQLPDALPIQPTDVQHDKMYMLYAFVQAL